jgi:alanine dehydrogenase
MNIGCAAEIMEYESRVGLRPNNLGVAELLSNGAHTVRIEKSAGRKSGFPDTDYENAGALLCAKDRVWRESDLVIKVKQPLLEEYKYLKDGLILICFSHLGDNPSLLNVLLENHITTIAYETIQLESGYIPILAAMSKIAGRVAYFDCVKLLMRHRGMMIGPNSTVAIIGLGNAGAATAELVVNANPKMLYLFDKNPASFEPLRSFYQQLSPYDLWFVQHDNDNLSHQQQLTSILAKTDLAIAATHIPGEKQKKIVLEWMEKTMQPNAVLADISIDQGGALESSEYYKRTGRQIFKRNGVWHYCVQNIPGKVPVDSTPALTRETFPYILEIAEKGVERAIRENPALLRGVNTYRGWITHEGLARSIGRMEDYKPLEEVI